ncbi:hypothetical protein [Haliangium sp.]|uniref:hypothetical protein n=1 Tax=Haliangium sp. TaxID=2663208 RepID=UPI003D0C30CD
MPTPITREQFVPKAEIYIVRLLGGVCHHPFEIANQSLAWGVRFIARLDERDFDVIRYSDVYPALQKVVAHMGVRRLGATGSSFRIELKLYDPYFASLDYRTVHDTDEHW